MMDADRFDALSKRVAAPTTRRATLGAMVASALGIAGAAPVAQAAPGQTCTMAFVAAVRMGPSVSQTLTPGGNQPGQLQGELSFSLSNSGKLERAALKLPNNTNLPVVGQATGNALQLRIALDGRLALVAMGVGEEDIENCKGAIDGTTSGPQMGDLGDWHAIARGLTGEPVAAGSGGKNRDRGGGTGTAGSGATGNQQRGQRANNQQGGATGPAGPTDETGRTGREGRGGKKETPVPNAGTPTCTAGQTACNNVCVDLQKDPANCGACGVKCENGSCVSGACTVAQGQGVACDAGLTRCGDACVNLRNDQEHCGACQQPCAAGVDCVNSVCGGSCPEGQTDCGDCADLMTSPVHCGDCFNACDAGVDCVNGVCGGGGGVACPDGQVDCGGFCADLNSDPANCGFCGVACAVGETCEGGFCVGQAAPPPLDCAGQGLTDCGGFCADLTSDPANCGTCGIACIAGEVCNGGVCFGQAAPPPVDCAGQGLTDCGGVCVDTSSDPANCGGCGNSCAAGTSCTGGGCV